MKKCMESFWTRTAKDKKLKKQAFTLVEILIVVAVIGILFVALVPRIDFAGDKAREVGVKNDFRSFELAAEQFLREKGGVAGEVNVEDLCDETNGINLYLDAGLQFDEEGECAKVDPWNQVYTVQLIKPSGTGVNPNNGAIVFISNGKDSLKSNENDNYVLAVTYVDGQIETATEGFSSNIVGSRISISADTTASMVIEDEYIGVKYKKN